MFRDTKMYLDPEVIMIYISRCQHRGHLERKIIILKV